jgi:hypothetical protein
MSDEYMICTGVLFGPRYRRFGHDETSKINIFLRKTKYSTNASYR